MPLINTGEENDDNLLLVDAADSSLFGADSSLFNSVHSRVRPAPVREDSDELFMSEVPLSSHAISSTAAPGSVATGGSASACDYESSAEDDDDDDDYSTSDGASSSAIPTHPEAIVTHSSHRDSYRSASLIANETSSLHGRSAMNRSWSLHSSGASSLHSRRRMSYAHDQESYHDNQESYDNLVEDGGNDDEIDEARGLRMSVLKKECRQLRYDLKKTKSELSEARNNSSKFQLLCQNLKKELSDSKNNYEQLQLLCHDLMTENAVLKGYSSERNKLGEKEMEDEEVTHKNTEQSAGGLKAKDHRVKQEVNRKDSFKSNKNTDRMPRDKKKKEATEKKRRSTGVGSVISLQSLFQGSNKTDNKEGNNCNDKKEIIDNSNGCDDQNPERKKESKLAKPLGKRYYTMRRKSWVQMPEEEFTELDLMRQASQRQIDTSNGSGDNDNMVCNPTCAKKEEDPQPQDTSDTKGISPNGFWSSFSVSDHDDQNIKSEIIDSIEDKDNDDKDKDRDKEKPNEQHQNNSNGQRNFWGVFGNNSKDQNKKDQNATDQNRKDQEEIKSEISTISNVIEDIEIQQKSLQDDPANEDFDGTIHDTDYEEDNDNGTEAEFDFDKEFLEDEVSREANKFKQQLERRIEQNIEKGRDKSSQRSLASKSSELSSRSIVSTSSSRSARRRSANKLLRDELQGHSTHSVNSLSSAASIRDLLPPVDYGSNISETHIEENYNSQKIRQTHIYQESSNGYL